MSSNEPSSREPLLSIVIPVKDEEASVPRLAAEISEVFSGVPFGWEVVWVDDGSTDATAERALALAPPHRLIRLDRNHGQSAALAAGFRAARGAWVGTLDGDGQSDPRDLLRQLDHARRHGLDMVNGVRTTRHDGFVRRASSRVANAARNLVTRDRVTDVGCSTRAVRRVALQDVPFFNGMHRFLPTLVRMRGYRVEEIPVNHRPRTAGRSKYGVGNRLWRGLRDLAGVRWLVDRQVRWRAWEAKRDPAGAPAHESEPGTGDAKDGRASVRTTGDRETPVRHERPPSALTMLALAGSAIVLLFAASAAADAPVDVRDVGLPWPWLAFGFLAQAAFGARFLIQWISSERAHASVVPRSFWVLSLIGGLMLFVYFARRGDPVGMVGQAFGVLVYLRNLYLIGRSSRAGDAEPAGPR